MRYFHSATKALFIAAIFVIATFASHEASAQTSATASSVGAAATIASAMGITEVDGLNFGGIIPSTVSATTVLIDETSSRTPSGTTTLVSGGTVTAASFSVTGDNDATYAFTSPGTVTLTSGSDTMTVDTWTGYSSTSSSSTLTLSALGADTMTIGATLNLANSQAAGVYTGTFNLTIDYN